ncbi:MAG TPA: hypothetical protein VNH64_02465 [Parvularculaceae bacterium]|nr:hypothetical protein [Parvularculaceae bacterium]
MKARRSHALLVLFRIALVIFAALLIVAGAALTISPVPFGFVLVLIGLLLLAAVAPAFIRWVRRHWPWFDRQMRRLEKRLPKWLAKPLRNTDFEEEQQNGSRKKR